MVDSSSSDKRLPYGILLILSRLSGAIVTVATLHVCMWAYGVPFWEPYQALSIITGLLALIIIPGTQLSGIRPGTNFWSNSVSVVSRWVLLVGALLILGYATKHRLLTEITVYMDAVDAASIDLCPNGAGALDYPDEVQPKQPEALRSGRRQSTRLHNCQQDYR